MVDAGMIPTVLVTDDDADFRGVVCEALVRGGVQTQQAADGDEALRVIEKTAIHMVLLDVHMSALMDEAIEREAARMRAYKILRKPVRLGKLREIVCGGLAEAYGWRPPE